jgi:hypothetical protein
MRSLDDQIFQLCLIANMAKTTNCNEKKIEVFPTIQRFLRTDLNLMKNKQRIR